MGFVFNPTAAAAAPPFNKGGKEGAAASSAVLKVPLVKGGWPAGPGGLVPSARIEQESRGELEGPKEQKRNAEKNL